VLVLLDREPVATFTVQKPANGDDTLLDKDWTVRVAVPAGTHDLGVTFVKVGSSLIDTARQPTQSRFNDRRHPRTAPAISQVSVTGPCAPKGVDDTPSRRRLFVCRPTGQDKAQDDRCAGAILSTLMRRAYRRPIANADVAGPMVFYRDARAESGFDAGIAAAVSAVLTNPEFLFRVESEPQKIAASAVYRVSALELASRLSFFLWSSIPDDELLDAAVRGRLSLPGESSRGRRAGCWPIGARSTWRQISPDSGCVCATSMRSIQTPLSIGTSTTTSDKPSGRRPSSSSTACCARIAAR
jgi:hypothetical protein